jgi:hypothetical protein
MIEVRMRNKNMLYLQLTLGIKEIGQASRIKQDFLIQ